MTGENIIRRSPVDFGLAPAETETINGFEAALQYGEQEEGPRLIDLSHCLKYDLQDSDLGRFKPWGIEISETPGQCVYENGILINRMNRTQCAIWNIGPGVVEPPEEKEYTETTDGLCLLAVCGPGALDVMDRISSLDFSAPGLTGPCLIQGPVMHIPAQSVLFSREGKSATIIFSFSRGYGQAMAEAILESGSDVGLAPGGLKDLNI